MLCLQLTSLRHVVKLSTSTEYMPVVQWQLTRQPVRFRITLSLVVRVAQVLEDSSVHARTFALKCSFLAVFLTFPSGPPGSSPAQAGKPPAAAGTLAYTVREAGPLGLTAGQPEGLNNPWSFFC
jgi:hypothetical protein